MWKVPAQLLELWGRYLGQLKDVLWMLWYSLILLLSELQEKIILPITPLTSLCAACHSSLKKKKEKETQIKKILWVRMRSWLIAHTSCCSDNWRGAWLHSLREGDMEAKHVQLLPRAQFHRNGWFWSFSSASLHWREKWPFPALCAWRTSTGTFVVTSVASIHSVSITHLAPSFSLLETRE